MKGRNSKRRLWAMVVILALIITNLSGGGVSVKAASTVASSMKLNQTSKVMTVGDSFTIKVTSVKPSKASKAATFKTSNKKIATVNSKGKVVAKQPGTVKITVTNKLNKKVKATVKVEVYQKTTSVALNYKEKVLKKGGKVTLKATVKPARAMKSVAWKSGDSTIATVSSKGVVTAKKEGTVYITAYSKTNTKKKASCKIIVTKDGKLPTVVTPTKQPEYTLAPTPTLTMGPEATVTTEPVITSSNEVSPTITQAVTPTDSPTPTLNIYGVENPRKDGNGEIIYDYITFGQYPQRDASGDVKEDIVWRVLAVEEEKALLLADKNLDVMPFHTENTEVTWEDCTLRSWLNGYSSSMNAAGKSYATKSFLTTAFTLEEREAICNTVLENKTNTWWGGADGNETTDRVFVLSLQESSDAGYGFAEDVAEDVARKRVNTAYVKAGGSSQANPVDIPEAGQGHWWWLRTTGRTTQYACSVSKEGMNYMQVRNVSANYGGVCPALVLDLSKTEVYVHTDKPVEISVTPKPVDTATTSPTVTVTPTVTAKPISTTGISATPEPKVTAAPTITKGATVALAAPKKQNDGSYTYDCVYFGNYPQSDVTGEKYEPIKWRVLAVKNNAADVYLMADRMLDVMAYKASENEITTENQQSYCTSWEGADIRKWLNGSAGFLGKAFTREEQNAILYYNYTVGGAALEDQIYLLPLEDSLNASYGFSTSVREVDAAKPRMRTAYATAKSATAFRSYWLADVVDGESWRAYTNTEKGYLYTDGDYVNNKQGICPVLHFNATHPVWTYAGTVNSKEYFEGMSASSTPTVTVTPEATVTPMVTPVVTVSPEVPRTPVFQPAPFAKAPLVLYRCLRN